MPRRAITGRFPRLLLLLLLLASACTGSKDLAAKPDAINLITQRSDKTYPVEGTAPQSVFRSIEANGPSDVSGIKGSGLTEARWSYTWTSEEKRGHCRIATMTISLDITVTLPRHRNETNLDASVLASWRNLVANIATHEERHVTIYLAGADEMKRRMDEIEPPGACTDLEAAITEVWADQQAIIDGEQAQFHVDEDARRAAERAPLESSLATDRQKLASLADQVKAQDATAGALDRRVDASQSELDGLQAQLRAIEVQYPDGAPPETFAKYESIRVQYNSKVPLFNDLVRQYNDALDQRTQLSDAYDKLLAETNAIVDQLNWLR